MNTLRNTLCGAALFLCLTCTERTHAHEPRPVTVVEHDTRMPGTFGLTRHVHSTTFILSNTPRKPSVQKQQPRHVIKKQVPTAASEKQKAVKTLHQKEIDAPLQTTVVPSGEAEAVIAPVEVETTTESSQTTTEESPAATPSSTEETTIATEPEEPTGTPAATP